MYSLVSAGHDATVLLPTATDSLPGAIASTSECFVTFSRLVVVNGLCPLTPPHEIWLVPRWRCAADHLPWQRVHSCRESHRSIPKALKLFGRETSVREFEVLCE
jgi:hypothetical protein